MGDRRLAEIRTEDGSMYFYTHWSGYELPRIAEESLRYAEQRKNDSPYALKMVLDYLIKECGGRDGALNCGIGLDPGHTGEDEYRGDPTSVLIDLNHWIALPKEID